MKKLVALILIFFIISLNTGLYAKEKRGADLKIQKKDGQQVRGELIAVKMDSLLLKEHDSGADVTVKVDEIKTITIVEKSKTLSWAGWGFLIGAGFGAMVGAASAENWNVTTEDGAASAAAFIGVPFALIGGMVGAFAGIDKTIKFEGKSDDEIKEILEDLHKKARVPDFQ